ncbi:hypothetical protein OH685_03780 [Acinetobacter pittii]|nr:hypothetical protein OH685_03780 [Acinetobacter pittii]
MDNDKTGSLIEPVLFFMTLFKSYSEIFEDLKYKKRNE